MRISQLLRRRYSEGRWFSRCGTERVRSAIFVRAVRSCAPPVLLAMLGVSPIGAPVTAQPDCRQSQLLSPAAESVVADARPTLRWSPIQSVNRYRVELVSRAPNGRALTSIDTQVTGLTFRPAQPLTPYRAEVKVRVSSGCEPDDGQFVHERPAAFHIDTSPLCPAPERIVLSRDGRNVEWPAVEGAASYEVTLLRADDASEVSRATTPHNSFPNEGSSGMRVAVVRPHCSTGYGPYGSALIEPTSR